MKDLTEIRPLDLINKVIEFAGITEDDFASSSRKQSIVVAKIIVTYCLLYLGISNTMIGKIIVKKHCTITHYKRLILEDRFMRGQIFHFKLFMSDRGWFVPNIDSWLVEMTRGDNKVIRNYDKKSL